MNNHEFDLHKRTHITRPSLPPHFPRVATIMAKSRSSSPSNPLLDVQNPGSSQGEHNNFFNHRSLNRINAMPEGNFESHANKIVHRLEKDEALMEDTLFSEQLRKEALRDLPQCLTMKRCVKSKLSKSVSQKSKRKSISYWKMFKYRVSLSFSKFRASVTNFNYFDLWSGTLKNIEGHFGSGYASYFKFLRWLFVMNLFVAIPSFVFISIPQILFDVHNSTQVNTNQFEFKDVFIGGGYFTETILYYGHYTSEHINLILNLNFDMPAAYFSTILVLYIVSFLALSLSVAHSYRRSFIETEGGLKNAFANKIFCGWDYGISTKEAAELKSSAIYNEIKELLSESLRDSHSGSCFNRFITGMMHVVTNILILILLAGTGFGIWKLLGEFSGHQDDRVVVTTVIVNIVLMVYPTVFTYVAKYEDYSNPRVALYINLLRTFLLGFVIIGVTLTFWLSQAESPTIDCWESRLGQEIYRLIIFDFLFSVVLNTLLEICNYVFLSFIGKSPKVEFNISKHSLQIIYNQGLFWVGLFYSPIIPIVVVLKMLIVWYIREISVQMLCKPPAKTWKAAQTQTWFLVMTFVTILLAIAVHGYTWKSIPTSTCGPFQQYNYTYEIITQGVMDLEKSSDVWKVVMFFTKPGVVALIIIGLCVIVYYMREKALFEVERVKMLREMLTWEAKDKQFLRETADQITRGQFQHDYNHHRLIDPTLMSSNESEHNNSRDYDIIQGPADGDLGSRFNKYT